MTARFDLELAWRVAGAAWLGAWAGLLFAFWRAFRSLGGWFDERLRWGLGPAIGIGAVTGHVVGGLIRDLAESGGARRAAFFAWALPGAAGAVSALVLQLQGSRDAASVVACALLAYWAGLDAGRAALPMLRGER